MLEKFLIVSMTNIKQKLEFEPECGIKPWGNPGMPQIWLTYDELAALTGCDRTQARSLAAAIPLDRRKSRDGNTRVKLSHSMTEAFFGDVLRQRLEQEIAACAGDLWEMRERMTAGPVTIPELQSASAVDIARSRAS